MAEQAQRPGRSRQFKQNVPSSEGVSCPRGHPTACALRSPIQCSIFRARTAEKMLSKEESLPSACEFISDDQIGLLASNIMKPHALMSAGVVRFSGGPGAGQLFYGPPTIKQEAESLIQSHDAVPSMFMPALAATHEVLFVKLGLQVNWFDSCSSEQPTRKAALTRRFKQ